MQPVTRQPFQGSQNNADIKSCHHQSAKQLPLRVISLICFLTITDIPPKPPHSPAILSLSILEVQVPYHIKPTHRSASVKPAHGRAHTQRGGGGTMSGSPSPSPRPPRSEGGERPGETEPTAPCNTPVGPAGGSPGRRCTPSGT